MLYGMQQPESAEDPGEAKEEGVLVVAEGVGLMPRFVLEAFLHAV